MMSKMLASTVTSVFTAARPALLESHGYLNSPAANSNMSPSTTISRAVTAAIAAGAAAQPGLRQQVRESTVRETPPLTSPVQPAVRPAARLHAVKVITAPRVRLDVTLPLAPREAADTKLHTLMQSGLGAYVADIQVTPRKIVVELNLAHDDVDFAFHTLISKLSEAIIGPVCTRVPRP